MMTRKELAAARRLLARVDSGEAADFMQAAEEGILDQLKLYGDGRGIFAVYKVEEEYHAVCSFRDVLRDYEILSDIERTVNGYLKQIKPEEHFTFVHDARQIYLNAFVCTLNFARPHYGLEYRLNRRNFAGGEMDLSGLSVREGEYGARNALFSLHARAFAEQTLRAGHPEGYDEDDAAYLAEEFSQPEDGKTLYTFYDGEKLAGYTLFYGDTCDKIAVDPDCRRRGFGRAMLQYSVGQAFRDGEIGSIRLNTFLMNVSAQRLYESAGFRCVGRYCINEAKPVGELQFCLAESARMTL